MLAVQTGRQGRCSGREANQFGWGSYVGFQRRRKRASQSQSWLHQPAWYAWRFGRLNAFLVWTLKSDGKEF